MASRFKLKAWNRAKKLLIRPGTVTLSRGELVLPDCVILQYSGFKDMNGQEIYEEDILLIGEVAYRVFWDETEITWMYKKGNTTKKLNQKFAESTVRGYNYYEREEKDS